MDSYQTQLEVVAQQIKKLDEDINFLLIVAITKGGSESIMEQHDVLYKEKLELLKLFIQLHAKIPNESDTVVKE